MARVGITGSYGGLNTGDEAILTSMLVSLRERIPGPSFTVFSRDAPHTRAHHVVDAVVPVRELTREESRAEVERLDLLVLGGGGILFDGESGFYLREVRLAQDARVPTMAYAVGAGPLSLPEDRRLVSEALAAMRAVTVRDAGAKRLLEHIGVEADVAVTADPALLLEPEPFTTEWLRAEGVPSGRALIGMSLREPGAAAPDLETGDHHRVLAQAADFIAERFDADILFIPMERGDIRLSHAVLALMRSAERGHVLKGRYKPAELMGLMQHLDLVVAMRLHVLIFAAVAGTPLMALPYAPKVGDFADDIGRPASVPVSADAVGSLLAGIDQSWDTRRRDAERVRGAVHRLRDRSRQTARIAAGCLEPASHDPRVMS